MKNVRKTTLVFTLLAGLLVFLSYCRQDDTILGLDKETVGANVLLAQKVATAPTLDGAIDAIWDKSAKLEIETVVPDPGGDVFRSLVGKYHNVTLRSAYDAQNIYFLAEWNDPSHSLARQPWYFDPATKKWALESGAPTFNANGTIARDAFGEDKLGMLWDVNNSVAGWSNATCFKSCHTGLSAADGFARHYTNSPSERVDMWHWKATRMNVNNMFDDQYQDDTYPNGRKSDDKTAGGDVANSQSLVITGTTTSTNVPKYVIPNRTGYYWILQSEIDNSTAKLITAVDENGVLTYDGGTIDPNADIEFQRKGTGIGSKAIPGISTSPFVGSRGDITCVGIHTGTGWILEFKRALKTGDTKNQDVDFSSLDDHPFGVAIFNNTGPAHAIKANLLLQFEK